MPVVQTQVLELAYEVSGPPDGSPALLLHGWPDAARGWRHGTRDGHGVALAQDAIDLADALGWDRFDVVGHDWGARAAYTMAALWPERVTSVSALALAYQPRAEFTMPSREAPDQVADLVVEHLEHLVA